jgi:Superinfection immunity protein
VHTAAATSGLAGINGAVLFLALVVTVILWCVPLIIAALCDLPREGPIAVLSLALGWTGVAWLAALVIVVVGAVRAGEPPLVVPWPGPRGGGAGQQPPRYPPHPRILNTRTQSRLMAARRRAAPMPALGSDPRRAYPQ